MATTGVGGIIGTTGTGAGTVLVGAGVTGTGGGMLTTGVGLMGAATARTGVGAVGMTTGGLLEAGLAVGSGVALPLGGVGACLYGAAASVDG